jgi:hypothetical protein
VRAECEVVGPLKGRKVFPKTQLLFLIHFKFKLQFKFETTQINPNKNSTSHTSILYILELLFDLK